ncbi:STAS domain-containing protein [Pedobacter montanisoli]|uniref:STAS domain-containing protein n=1 Tax=Pedobacter montanisoli TaxID=2923277 RepID=A0ABS9ZYK5_9SPHI|nr:STAS domain-containing protein [Pedobacter montanisoli]MCJ0743378.1 STAS domain-containing protein [Pedobacter montanisoli]
MKFSTDKHEKYVVIKLDENKFTNDNTPALKSEFILLNTEGFRNIVLDLSEVTECNDSQDLSCLLVGDRLCKSADGVFVVCGVSKNLAQIIKMSNIHQSVTFVNKLDEATDLIFMEEIEKELRGSVDKG